VPFVRVIFIRLVAAQKELKWWCTEEFLRYFIGFEFWYIIVQIHWWSS